MPHVNKKNTSEKEKFKQKTRPRKNYEWIKRNTFEKIRSKNSKKTVKIKVKLPHVIKKPQARKRNFVETTFSHSTLKSE